MLVESESIRVTLLVIDTLEGLRIPYALGGSLASSIHGVMRSTLDADIVADMHPEHVAPFVAALSEGFYADDGMILDAIARKTSFNLVHYETSFKVDVFIPMDSPYGKMQLARRLPALITPDPAREVFVTTAEDVILSKLEWYRMGGALSDRQWSDILGVVKTQLGQLDLDYLRHWARELQVDDLLERALAEGAA
jgi:hypothetical protein